jgi:predicted short-subunit dehydrogenase-like oxidoreductase (DUF2520 family)
MRELERETNHPRAALPALVLVGRGRVGCSLQRAAGAGGIESVLAGREDLEQIGAAEVVLLCVPDSAIGEAAAAVAEHAPGLRFIGHTSGATSLDALEPADAQAFSLHPLQTVPAADTDLTAAPCAVAGSSPGALDLAQSLALAFGMRPFRVREEDRAAYHAAASMASNFLVALEESAAALLAGAGAGKEARELLAPLVLRSAANWADRGAGALTGPIARGDEQTVQRHLAALAEGAPELLQMYRALAERTRAIAAAEAAA